MSMLPEIPNTYLEAFVVGLLYGFIFRTSECLLHVASYIAGIRANFRKEVLATLTLNLGSVTAYAGAGTLVLLEIFTLATATIANNP
jgi:hypothetical protein